MYDTTASGLWGSVVKINVQTQHSLIIGTRFIRAFYIMYRANWNSSSK